MNDNKLHGNALDCSLAHAVTNCLSTTQDNLPLKTSLSAHTAAH